MLVLLLVGVLLTSAASAAPTAAAAGDPGSAHAAWWRWAFSFPLSQHPLNPGFTSDCAVGQRGKVWYLGGVVNSGAAVTRECTVPSGTKLVVAVANVECSTLEGPPFGGTDPASLRTCAAGVADPSSPLFITDRAASLDGVPLRVLRAPSPVFDFTVPNIDDNILGCSPLSGGTGCPATSGQSVADGYLLKLYPLPVGVHELHTFGFFPAFGFALDITHRLTVVPRGLTR
jgi:hypothetical protein